MGKRLIIPNADFSANAIDGTWTDITNIVTGWEAGAYASTNGTQQSSSVFKRSTTKVDVTAYAGKFIRFTMVAYTSSSLQDTKFGIAFYDSSNTFISAIAFPKNENVAGSARTYLYIDNIPQTAAKMGVTYLSDAKIAEISGLTFMFSVSNS